MKTIRTLFASSKILIMRMIKVLFCVTVIVVFGVDTPNLSANERCARTLFSKFSSLEAKNLNNEIALFPNRFDAELNIVFISLTREHGNATRKWKAFISTQLESIGYTDYTIFDIAVIGMVPTPIANTVVSISRAEISPDSYDTFFPIFSDKEEFLSSYGIAEKKYLHVVSVDARGNTALLACGVPNQEMKQHFVDTVNTLFLTQISLR